jgi:hypothetical protein
LDPYGLCASQYSDGIHGGILAEGTDYDFGPVGIGGKVKLLPLAKGACPWDGNNNSDGSLKNINASIKELSKRENGVLSHIKRNDQLIKCKCATCGDVHTCLKKECEKWNNKTYFFIYPNCWSFVDSAKKKCCLK